MKHIIIPLSMSLIIACSGDKNEAQNITDQESHQYDLVIQEKLGDNFSPLVVEKGIENNTYPNAKVKLGHFLYFDTRLSKDGNNSCNSCHNLATFGVDQLPVSPGDLGKTGDRNSPTVLNAALHKFQFWDGRAKDVEEQAGMPILNPIEMAIPNKEFLLKRLSQTELYPALFKEAFPGESNPLTYENIEKAIGAFERILITPSRFDQYLAGDKSALSVLEKKGLVTFFNVGCNTCHTHALLGGDQFQKFGVFDEYWKHTQSKKIDLGVYDFNKNENLKYHFKVPSLRNIEHTFPYFHDGSVSDLTEAVHIMAKVQLDYNLNAEEAEKIVAFLKTLSGEIPEFIQKAPEGL